MGVIFLSAFSCRFYRIDQPPLKTFDEKFYVFTGRQLVDGDRKVYDRNIVWAPEHGLYARYTPPLGSLLVGLGIKLFGNRPVGWRMASVFFGSLAVAGVYLIFLTLTGKKWWAMATAFLYNSDFLTFTHSRVGALDAILVGLVILTTLIFCKFYLPGRPGLAKGIWLGFVLGLALAVKWSAVLTLGVIVVILAWLAVQRKAYRLFLDLAALAGTALAVYALVFLPFLPKLDLIELARLHREMVDYHTRSYNLTANKSMRLNMEATRPWFLWPLDIRPEKYFVNFNELTASPGKLQYQVRVINASGNPLLYWALVPAALAVLGMVVLGKIAPLLAIPALLFFGNWLPWAASPRPTYWFYFLPAVPFGTIALGFCLARLWGQGFRFLVGAYIFSVIALFFILYPTFTSILIPSQGFQFLDRVFGPIK